MGVGISQKIAKIARSVARGNIVGPRNDVQIFRHQIFHRIDLTATNSQIEFYNVAPSMHVCNMPAGANGLPNDYAFVCTKTLAVVEYGYAVDGTAVAGAEGFAASSAPLAVANDIRHVLDKGMFRLWFADEKVLEVYGLNHLAGGNGANIQSTSEGNAAAVSLVNVTNGVPHDDNGFAMSPWKVLAPSQSVRATVDWNFNRALTANLVLKITLDGIMVRR